MRHIIWRNRASAILGIFVMLIPFTGLPEVLRDSFVVLAGFLISLFGFYHGSANYALVEENLEELSPAVDQEIKNKSHHRSPKVKVHNEPTSSV